ncbi:MAG: HAD family hydrolase [Patescibacteria group bacterium]
MNQPIGIVVDFDGTVADTFQPSPNNIGVNEAYAQAVAEVFGEDGTQAYEDIGGLQNRAPGELVRVLIEQCPTLTKRLVEEAPEKIFVVATDALVQAKLHVLTREIGTTWPLPCIGFQKFCEALFALRRKGVNIRFAILSSGHTPFIRTTFEVWGRQWPVFTPEVVVSDDELRPLPIDPDRKVKPHPFLFEMIEARLGFDRTGMVYIGDDPNKDGRLAMAAGVPFGLFDPIGTKLLPEGVAAAIQFENWSVLAEKLKKNTAALKRGELQAVF